MKSFLARHIFKNLHLLMLIGLLMCFRTSKGALKQPPFLAPDRVPVEIKIVAIDSGLEYTWEKWEIEGQSDKLFYSIFFNNGYEEAAGIRKKPRYKIRLKDSNGEIATFYLGFDTDSPCVVICAAWLATTKPTGDIESTIVKSLGTSVQLSHVITLLHQITNIEIHHLRRN